MPIFLVEMPDNITASTLQKTLNRLSQVDVYVTMHRNGNHSYVEEVKNLFSNSSAPFDNVNDVTSTTELEDTFVSDHVKIKETVDERPTYEPPKEPNACSIGGA